MNSTTYPRLRPMINTLHLYLFLHNILWLYDYLYHIYVLKLRNNKYYVGKTDKPTFRLNDHFSKNGSYWTKKHKPISIFELRPNCLNVDEQIITQEYMKKYGINNVRGGPWCKVSLTDAEKQMITHMNQSNSDVCYKCDKTGHFARDCFQGCTRCGRDSHTAKECYAKTNTDGEYLSSDEDEDMWCCSFCDKSFSTEKGAMYHELRYCKGPS